MNVFPINARSSLEFPLYDDDVLFFLHIPKTAGISLINLLDARYKRSEVLPIHTPYPGWSGKISKKRLKSTRLIRVHLTPGMAVWIKKHVVQNPVYITMLRDPVERVVSHFKHIIRKKENHLHDRFIRENIQLDDFVLHFSEAINMQTQMILNTIPNPSKRIGKAQLLAAQQCLEQFAFVGLTERFRESGQLLNYMLGWPPVSEMPIENIAPKPTRRNDLAEGVTTLIAEQNKHDEALHRHGSQLFEARFSQMIDELCHRFPHLKDRDAYANTPAWQAALQTDYKHRVMKK